jgi:hypothetical protein
MPEAAKSADRCATHPGVAAVARCTSCGRALCLTCALPVRGRVLGAECLPSDIVTDPVAVEPVSPGPGVGSRIAGIGISVAAAASLLPWTRFGTGSGLAGAWGAGRWSLLSAIAALAGTIAWVMTLALGATARWLWWAVAGFGSLAAAGALLAALNGPPLTKPALAPWLVAFAGGLAATGAALSVARTRHPRR